MVDRAFESQLRGYSLTTALIDYWIPDRRGLIQEFVLQQYDIPPRFPRLIKYLDWWSHNIDGRLAGVRVMCAKGIVSPVEFRHIGSEWRLH